MPDSPIFATATEYFGTLEAVRRAIQAHEPGGAPLDFDAAVAALVVRITTTTAGTGRLLFVGNGGSAAIASHMAVDYSKNGRMRSTAFNDPMVLTCLGNDLGYENVFSAQIAQQARPEDTLVAISSSGRSPNILNAVAAARSVGCPVVGLSGFDPDNPLRRLGDLNFYVPSHEYGFVELLHLSVLHCALDIVITGRRAHD